MSQPMPEVSISELDFIQAARGVIWLKGLLQLRLRQSISEPDWRSQGASAIGMRRESRSKTPHTRRSTHTGCDRVTTAESKQLLKLAKLSRQPGFWLLFAGARTAWQALWHPFAFSFASLCISTAGRNPIHNFIL